jgi:hypothetical protein
MKINHLATVGSTRKFDSARCKRGRGFGISRNFAEFRAEKLIAENRDHREQLKTGGAPDRLLELSRFRESLAWPPELSPLTLRRFTI